jgi:hypothetical protein
MATESIRVATQAELAARAERGATLAQLLDQVDEQDDELQLYCWMVYERRSRGVLWGEPKEWRFLEQDIGG